MKGLKKLSQNQLAEMVGVGGAEYYRKLRDAGILVRYYSNPRIENFVRITIGTDDQMDEVIRVTKEILSDREGK